MPVKNCLSVQKKNQTLTKSELTLFAFNTKLTKNKRRRVRTEIVKCKRPGVDQLVPAFNRLSVPDRSLYAFLVPALQSRPSLNYTKQRNKEVSKTRASKLAKLKRRGEILTHLRSGFPTDGATSGYHPNHCWIESRSRPQTQRKSATSNT